LQRIFAFNRLLASALDRAVKDFVLRKKLLRVFAAYSARAMVTPIQRDCHDKSFL